MKRLRYYRLPVFRLFPRQMRPDELPHVRRLWWRFARQGHRLPAEKHIIVLDGGRR